MTTLVKNLGLMAVAILLGVGNTAVAEKSRPKADKPAKLIVEEGAKLFSTEALDKAKKSVSSKMGIVDREVHLETYSKLSEADQKRFDEVKGDASKKAAFWREWALSKASGDRGLLVLINFEPGHVHVLTSKAMSEKFTQTHREEVQNRLVSKFKEAGQAKKDGKPDAVQQKLRDEGLISAMDYASLHIPESFGTKPSTATKTNNNQAKGEEKKAGGINWMSILCIGASIMLGIWLVTSLIRAFSGGGGGGGYGGGGGGGGFFPSLLGGLFGAAAGMWMYDHFFGGHSSSAFGNEGGGDSYGNEPMQDDGNFGDGGDGGGGDFGGGDFGGGGDF